jgi:hypothetical protein
MLICMNVYLKHLDSKILMYRSKHLKLNNDVQLQVRSKCRHKLTYLKKLWLKKKSYAKQLGPSEETQRMEDFDF